MGYNYDIDYKSGKDDAAVNQSEDNLKASEESAKAESLLITGRKTIPNSMQMIDQ